jgi:hypothetical protein
MLIVGSVRRDIEDHGGLRPSSTRSYSEYSYSFYVFVFFGLIVAGVR